MKIKIELALGEFERQLAERYLAAKEFDIKTVQDKLNAASAEIRALTKRLHDSGQKLSDAEAQPSINQTTGE